ncbi:hypothetical protein [Lihuaxuella thermophila]|uniref:Lipoprotein n=1 Tax=Lihuaxuella thermophila TaxID=1173111 RepID=A0A1H8E6M9_9BACL|nr:hypothetical protein [Lihuaxuella thermophila]SEN14764.1 hypothetical protein SAMN05444955_106145 [Lihuaxuella thermophila]
MYKNKSFIFFYVLLLVFVLAGCSEQSSEEKSQEKDLPKLMFEAQTITLDGKNYTLDPRLQLNDKNGIGQAVGLIYDTAVVHEINGIPGEKWLTASFEGEGLVFREQGKGDFNLSDFAPDRLEIHSLENPDQVTKEKVVTDRKAIDELVKTITEKEPVRVDTSELKDIQLLKEITFQSDRYPNIAYHLSYIEKNGRTYLREHGLFLMDTLYEVSINWDSLP